MNYYITSENNLQPGYKISIQGAIIIIIIESYLNTRMSTEKITMMRVKSRVLVGNKRFIY